MEKEYGSSSDEELIRRLRNGDSGVWDYLLEKYKDMVRRRSRAMFLTGGDTDDLIQEGMIGLFKAIRDFREDRDASFRTFANVCVDRQLKTAVKNSQRKKHMPLNSYISLDNENEEEPSPVVQSVSPEDMLIEREQQENLMRTIQESLSKLENKVLSLYLSGDSYQEIADKIGKPLKSVDNTMSRLRRKIRENI
ncbi:MAG: RNA polymerase sporulation sigma factor SigH [Blautia sp.]|nr:RNA polymerase sporulation sigma factor SigH [Blautia sp.]